MKRDPSNTPSRSRRGDKARAYHRRWCVRFETPDGRGIVWRFALAPKFRYFTQFVEAKDE